MCGSNAGAQLKLVNGVDVGTANGGIGNQNLKINGLAPFDSDFDVAEVSRGTAGRRRPRRGSARLPAVPRPPRSGTAIAAARAAVSTRATVAAAAVAAAGGAAVSSTVAATAAAAAAVAAAAVSSTLAATVAAAAVAAAAVAAVSSTLAATAVATTAVAAAALAAAAAPPLLPGQAMCANGAPPGYFRAAAACDETADGGEGSGRCQCWKLPGIIPPDFPGGTGYINPHDVNPHDGTKGTWHDGCGCGALRASAAGATQQLLEGTEYTTAVGTRV